MPFLGAPDPFTGPAMPNPLGMVLVQGNPSTDPSALRIPGPQVGNSKNDLVWETQGNVGGVIQFPVLFPVLFSSLPNLSFFSTGCLTTRDPRAVRESAVGANDGTLAHGIPINFGAGRGNWVAGDARLFEVECETTGQSYYYPYTTQPDAEWATYVFKPGSDGVRGDFDFYFLNKNSLYASGQGPFSLKQLSSPPDIFASGYPYQLGGMRIRIKYEKNQ